MKKSLLLFVLLISADLFSQVLPRYMTEEEKLIMKNYTPPVSEAGFVTPPTQPVRTMAEWEELEGVLITWTSFQSILRQIVDHAQEEGKVFIVCSDSNSVKSYLTSGGVPLKNLKFIIAPFNSIWVRDYGPWCVYSNDADSLYLIDWIYNRPRPNDDLIPGVFAAKFNIPLYQMTQAPYNFIATGGNFMNDAHGTGFSSKLILNENPSKTEAEINSMMNLFMGINNYVKMDNLPYDGIHHIDMHMKLLDEETLLVGQYPPGVADGPKIEENLQYILNNFQSCFGRPFKVVRIPMPPDASGNYPNNGGDYRTYTNSVIVNKTVIVPTYSLQYDTTALRIYRDAMPGYKIVGINSNQIIPLLGAIHCITKEIGVSEPVFISHPKILSTVNSFDGYEVKAYIKTRSGVANATVFWTADTALGFNSIAMSEISPDTFAAKIPLQPIGTKVFYYISAVSQSGKTVIKPLTSPEGAYRFEVDFAVPVELLTFSAAIEGSVVSLNWKTATETNNSGFEIERSFDKLNWDKIGFLEGYGTTTEPRSYTYSDNIFNAAAGPVFYKLKQIDFDGTYYYSDIVEVSVAPSSFSLSQNYPNPFNPSTKIKYSVPLSETRHAPVLIKLNVYDVLGNEIATLVDEEKPAGRYEVEFSGHSDKGQNLSSGIYFYTLRAGTYIETRKMLLIK